MAVLVKTDKISYLEECMKQKIVPRFLVVNVVMFISGLLCPYIDLGMSI